MVLQSKSIAKLRKKMKSRLVRIKNASLKNAQSCKPTWWWVWQEQAQQAHNWAKMIKCSVWSNRMMTRNKNKRSRLWIEIPCSVCLVKGHLHLVAKTLLRNLQMHLDRVSSRMVKLIRTTMLGQTHTSTAWERCSKKLELPQTFKTSVVMKFSLTKTEPSPVKFTKMTSSMSYSTRSSLH